jgi:DNA modification methylase
MIHTGDSLTVLQTLPAASVQCCVTSPPYWGLRDYGHDGQIGLEETPEQYVARLVAVFAEVRRVLADDGVLWLNLGDSYAGSSMSGGVGSGTLAGSQQGAMKGGQDQRFRGHRSSGLKPKDLVGIPWRVAFALQADGWYLRSDTIWHKPNPMPESVRDRPTKAHEYVFLLSKSARYFYDQDAIREPYDLTKLGGRQRAALSGSFKYSINDRQKEYSKLSNCGGDGGINKCAYDQGGRNARSVWTIPTQPYSGAHFAVMPPALADRCIKSGSRVGDTVLDPFSGAGTTGMVARRLRRQYVGIELNPEFADMARRRIDSDAPLLNRMAL